MTNYSAFTTMLSSLGTYNNIGSNSLFNFNFTDYANIRNGTYSKLMRAYYAQEVGETDKSTSSKKNNFSTSTAKATNEELAKTEELATGLVESAQSLYKSNSLFNKKSVTGEDGKVTMDYDREAIYKKMDAFISDYNSLIKQAEESDVSGIANAANSMITATEQNAKMLESIGISINESNNTLRMDKDTFLKADMSNVKALLKGTGTYAYSVAAKASLIDHYAQSESLKSNTYSRTGNYSNNYSSGSIYNNIF